jgi:hypothetical protein
MGQTPTIVDDVLTFAVPPSTTITVVSQTSTQSTSSLSSSSATLTSSSSSLSSSSSIISTTATGCSATAINPSQCNSSPTPIGAIVGSVIGGLLLLAFLAFLIWFFIRKRHRDEPKNIPSTLNTDAATAAAFHNQQIEVAEVEAKPGSTAYENNQASPTTFNTTLIPDHDQGSRGYVYQSVPSPGPPAPAYSPNRLSSTGNDPTSGSRFPAEERAELEGTDGGYVNPNEIGDAAYRAYRPL